LVKEDIKIGARANSKMVTTLAEDRLGAHSSSRLLSLFTGGIVLLKDTHSLSNNKEKDLKQHQLLTEVMG